MPCCMCEKYKWDDPQEVVYTDPEDGKEYCLFHAPAEHKGMDVDDFNAQVLERIQAPCKLEDENRMRCLVGAVFPGDIAFDDSLVFPRISFSHAQFSGNVSFQGVEFSEYLSFDYAEFSLLANFSEVRFKSIADFSNSRFLGVGNFEKSTFEDDAKFSYSNFEEGYFHRSTFEKDVCFSGVRFVENGNFNNAYIGQQALFDKSIFESEAHFEESEFVGNAFFKNVKFMDRCELEYIVFHGHASFVEASFKSFASFKNTHFNNGVSFFLAKFIARSFFVETHFDGEAVFADSEFGEGGDFSGAKFKFRVMFNGACFKTLILFRRALFKYGCSFHEIKLHGRILLGSGLVEGQIIFKDIQVENNAKVELENMTLLSGVTFQNFDPACLDLTHQRDFANIHFIDSFWEKNGRIKVCTEDKPGQLQITRDFYQRMKAKYKDENNEYEASKWHVAEKEAQLKILAQRRGEGFNWFMLWLYKLVSGFGENPGRAFGVLACLLVVPLLFYIMDIEANFFGLTFHSHQVADPIVQWLKFIPLTRAVIGDEPGYMRALMLSWQLLITLQAALFAFALRNNFRR